MYLHAAHAENLPTTILEALASGLPVVATAVGGIPEQVSSLDGLPGTPRAVGAGLNKATGALVPHADPASMAASIVALLTEDGILRRLAQNGGDDRQRAVRP